MVIYAQRHKPVTEENVGLRIVNGSDLGKLKNGRATMKHDEATRETKALRFNVK